jgi:hypothetical protein
MVVEEELSLSHIPAGTVTWNGMPNVIWTMNREKGLGAIFATQLLPADDEKTVDLTMAFTRGHGIRLSRFRIFYYKIVSRIPHSSLDIDKLSGRNPNLQSLCCLS